MNIEKQFDRDYLLYDLDLPYNAIEDEIVGTSRWSIHHEIVFQDKDGKFYQTCYSEGATECQEEKPWEYKPVVVCTEVEKKDVVVEKWVPKSLDTATEK